MRPLFVLLLAFSGLGATHSGPGEPTPVSGRVVDARGLGMPGAVVRVVGHCRTTATDADGYFLLRLLSGIR